MRILWAVHDFRPDNVRLQPWLTVHRVGCWLAEQGHDVHVVTDVAGDLDDERIVVHQVSTLRGYGTREITDLIHRLRPDHVVAMVTPLNLVTTPWFGIGKSRWTAFTSYPFYRANEILRAVRWVRPGDLLPYARHLAIPSLFYRIAFRRSFHAVICQSKRTKNRIRKAVGNSIAVKAIPAGVETKIWFLQEKEERSDHFLYMGASRAIRGYTVLLQAVRQTVSQGIKLKVLARGADEEQLAAMRKTLKSMSLEDEVEIVGGWMNISDLVVEVRQAAAVVLPFVLVPSELPVSVLEALAVGTPVIVTDVDGLPSAVGDAGVVVPPGDPNALAQAFLDYHRGLKAHLCAAAWQKAKLTASWEEVGKLWQDHFYEF